MFKTNFAIAHAVARLNNYYLKRYFWLQNNIYNIAFSGCEEQLDSPS